MINEPKYDEDVVNLGYLKRILGLKDTDSVAIIVTKNYGTAPNPPYSLNDTYMYDGKVYICVKAREIGEFNPDDWQLMADNSVLGDYATNNKVDTAVGALNQKIESTATGLNIEVAKKLNKTDFTHANIVLAINDNSSTALINADKINLNAADILNLLANNTINLTSKNITISSDNLSVDKNGNMVLTDTNNTNYPVFSIKYGDISNKMTSGGMNFINGDNTASYHNTGFNVENEHFGNKMSYNTGQGILEFYAFDELTFSADMMGASAIAYNNLSLVELKKNFKPLSDAMKIIDDTDIYEYHLKSQDDTEKKHIGLVIGDDYKYSKKLTNQKNQAVDIYSMVSVCLQAIKEQNSKIKKLEEEINEIKRSN